MPDVTADHNAHLHAIDPLLAPAPALDAASDGFLQAQAGDAVAQGVSRVMRLDASDPDAVWGALHRHSLDVRLAGPDPDRARALEGVLDAWLERIAGQELAGDVESSATIVVPARDSAIVPALTSRGFGLVGVSSIRLRPRAQTAAAPRLPHALAGGTVRLATLDDADVLGGLDERLLALDSLFGGVSMREGAAAMFADAYRERLAKAPDTTWVLEREGRITGFVHAVPDEHSPEPDSHPLTVSGGQYLVVMYLDEAERGSGQGAALADLAHDILDASGSPYTLLSYAAANPRSGPFWARMGYRPVSMQWQRRPAVLR